MVHTDVSPEERGALLHQLGCELDISRKFEMSPIDEHANKTIDWLQSEADKGEISDSQQVLALAALTSIVSWKAKELEAHDNSVIVQELDLATDNGRFVDFVLTDFLDTFPKCFDKELTEQEQSYKYVQIRKDRSSFMVSVSRQPTENEASYYLSVKSLTPEELDEIHLGEFTEEQKQDIFMLNTLFLGAAMAGVRTVRSTARVTRELVGTRVIRRKG